MFQKIILFGLVFLSHIIVLFIFSNKRQSESTFSKKNHGSSVIKLTKIFVNAKKVKTENEGTLENLRANKNQLDSRSQNQKLASGVKNEKALYITSIKDKIERAKSYPFAAKRLRLEGIIEVKFQIREDGKIKNLSLKNKDGNDIFIKHTKSLFETINFFDPLPKTLKGEIFELSLDIVYKI